MEEGLTGGGEMLARIRAFDWTRTPLGPPDRWPQSLKTAVSICLDSRFPMIVRWGEELIALYNDAYIPILGQKHPGALGSPGLSRALWGDPETRAIIEPMLRGVLTRGEATWSNDRLLIFERNGFTEEAYLTFSYSPIRVESGTVGGVFTAVSETTQKVVGERRLRVLRELTARTSEETTAPGTYAAALSVLGSASHDVPFCLLYMLDATGTTAILAGLGGALPSEAAPKRFAVHAPDASWPLTRAWTGAVEVEPSRLGPWARALPGGPWPEPARRALVLPILHTGEKNPSGFLIAGTSPRLPLDEHYRDFLTQVADHIANAIARVRAYEEERRRAEALAELDRAKTVFFNNVSHEFRTPLTLMLGPTEELRSGAPGPLTPSQEERLDTLHRNTLRLLKLVNSLLDFSRIEAGRVQAAFVPTDLSELTRGLASAFRSATDQAGLTLTLDCPPLSEPLYVDRDLWEKIVLNLLSNAFKFTFEGGITVRLRPGDGQAVLDVEDTGTGIPPEALPHLFERFYRVEGARSRTHEGSGIGLALVQELVKLHGGTLSVTSTPGKGSRFRVVLPTGRAHLPAERIGDPTATPPRGAGAAPFVDEAQRWLPGPAMAPPEAREGQGRILLADDTADMREYVSGLLRDAGHSVEAVSDGHQALAAVRERRPELVLTDVMMPGLDGFGLLRELRASERTRTLPVIMISARAGEESRVEGLSQGADDYLVKPFSARELLARVRTQLELSRLRATLESEKFRSFVLNVPGAVYECQPESPWRFSFMSEPVLALTGHCASEFLAGLTWAPLVHPEDLSFVETRITRAVEQHTSYELEYRLLHTDGGTRWVSEVGRAIYDETGHAYCLEGILFDITSRKATEEALQQYQRQVTRTLAENATSALYLTDDEGRCTYMNPAAERMTGHVLTDVRGRRLHDLVHPAQAAVVTCAGSCSLERLLIGPGTRGGAHEDLFVRAAGGALPVAVAASPILREGKRVGAVLEARDLTEQKRSEAALQEAQLRKDEFLAMLAHELRNPMAPLRAALKLIEARTSLDDKGRHAIEIIERQTTNLARLVDDLLDVSRITRGRIELRKTLVELPAVVESALQSVQPLLDERRHEVSVTLPRKPLRTLGDAVRIEQIIVNLLTNAAKYTEPGGTLRVGLERAGTDAEIRVKDTGIGLAREMLGRVFNLFEQAERPLDRSQGGLGIGLTMVKNLVELHGGTIEARSEGLGQGSEFIVRLPLAEETAAPRTEPDTREEPLPTGARRILVVDDNLDAADTLAELLQTWDHTVWQAHDGFAALKGVEEHHPDIVLLDIGLPGMDGYEVARRLRASPLGEGLTLVALTGYGQASDRIRAMEAGFDQHFVKPVDIDGLQKFIEQRPARTAR